MKLLTAMLSTVTAMARTRKQSRRVQVAQRQKGRDGQHKSFGIEVTVAQILFPHVRRTTNRVYATR